MSNLKIETDKIKKIMKISLSGGFISTEASKNTFSQYNQMISQINPREYSLLLDCTDCGVYEQGALVYLEQFYKTYMETGFKHIVFVEAKNVIQNIQLKKVAKNVPGFTGVFFPTLNDAVNECMK